MNSRWTYVAIIIALAALCSLPSASRAQTPASSQGPAARGDDELPLQLREDVEVTAARSVVSSDRSPASSSVVTRTEIEQRGTRVLDQVLGTSPGVSAYRTRGMQDNEMGIGLRGFSGRGTGQSRVLVLFDGQPMNNGYTGAVDWSSVPVGEVDRVEVVRGPFSALYGGNAMGGVVNVITRPVDRRSAEVFGQYGSQGTGTFVGRYADRIGRTGFSVGYEYSGTDGYETQEVLRPATVSTPTGGTPVTGVTRFATSTGGVTYGAGFRGDNWYRRHAMRARVEQTFTDRTVGSFQYIRQTSTTGYAPYRSTLRTADGQTIDNGAVVFQDPEAGDVWMRMTVTPTNYLGLPGGRDANMFQAQVLHTTAGDGLLRVQAGAFDTPIDWYGSPGANATLAGGAGSQTRQSNLSVYGNVQWSAVVHGRHALTLGTDTRRDTGRIEAWTTDDYLAGAPFLSRSTSAAGNTFTQGLYVQDQFAVSDALQITAGARYDYWRAFDGETQTIVDTPPSPFDSRSTSAVTGKIAAVYRADDDTILRASVGTSFRPPSVFELYRDTRLSTSLLLGNPNVDPERLMSWEVAIRQRAGRALTLDATYYDSRVRDLIYRATDLDYDPTGTTRRLLNAGEGRLRGLEFGVTWRPAAWLTLSPNYTLSDATITRNDPVPATVGMRLPWVPRHTAGATASGVWRALTVSASLRHQSDVYSTDTNTDTVNGVPGSYNAFTEVDLSTGWRLTDRVTLQLSVENVLDEQYYMFYRNPGRLVVAGVRLRY